MKHHHPSNTVSAKALIALSMAVIIISLIASCGRCHNCEQNTGFVLRGFSKTEIASAWIAKYKAGSNFTQFIDSTKLSFWPNPDSTYYYNTYYNDSMMHGLLDFKVVIPVDSISYQVTNILFTHSGCSACPEVSMSNLDSFTVNGIPKTPSALVKARYGGYIEIDK